MIKRFAFPHSFLLYTLLLLISYFWFSHLAGFSLLEKTAFILRAAFPFLIESYTITLILLWGVRPGVSNFLLKVALMIIVTIGGIQFNSFLMCSDFLIPEALANFGYIRLVFNTRSVFIQGLFLIAGVLLIFSLNRSGLKTWTISRRLSVTYLLSALSAPIFTVSLGLILFFQPEKAPGYPLYNDFRSPLVSFITTTTRFFILFANKSEVNRDHIRDIDPGINFDQPYPQIKPWLYKKQLSCYEGSAPGRRNVIVFFVESFSARLCGVYNKNLADLTPNLNAFADSSLVVYNYYNHTAATSRGIRGQLCSMFPVQEAKIGGDGPSSEKPLPSLNLKPVPDFLKPLGYTSTFMCSEEEKKGCMDNLATNLLHYDSIVFMSKILRLTGDRKPCGPGGYISDHQLTNALNFYLKSIPQNQPFFISVYNMGTHAWLDHSKESLKYRDGANNIYNAVYSFDHAFGAFLREFKKSVFYKNTMIIVTADHCYPPLEEYIKIAGDNYAPFFVDKIPMIIYSPGQKLPKIYNPGDIRTSLDFAPTLLHLLNVPSGENHFLGRSLFEPPFTRNTFAAIGEYVLLITGKGVFAKPENREDLASMIRIKEFVYYITGLEQENRIWKPAGNK